MTIIPALVKNLPAFINAGIKLVGGLVKGIILGTAKLIKGIGDLAKKGINKLKETFEGKSPLEIGKMLVQGLWNGMNDAKQWVLDKIKGFGKSVLKGIKKIFGISSPSKEFAIIGRYNVMGLEEGMKKESLKLQDSFDSMFSLSPNLYGTASTHISPQVNVINNITVKQDALGQMVKDIKTFSGGAKNDYSYGMGA
jgi:phage-related protein